MNQIVDATKFDDLALEKIETEFDGSKEARAGFNTIRQTIISLGGVDPGEPSAQGASLLDAVLGGARSAPFTCPDMEDLMKIAVAEPDEIARIMTMTPSARDGRLVVNNAGIPYLYNRGAFFPVPDLLAPSVGAAQSVDAFKAELRNLSQRIADFEEYLVSHRVAPRVAKIKASTLADHEEIEPGLPVGLARDALNKFGAACRTRNPPVAMAKHRAARNAAIANDQIKKAWARLGTQLPPTRMNEGTINNLRAAVVGPDAVLRTDGSIAVHSVGYLSTSAVDWNVLLPNEANDPAVTAAMASTTGYTPKDTRNRALASLFLPFVARLAGNDQETVWHILGLIGAKLARRHIGQRGLLMFGATGTGKSVLIKVLHIVFGGGAEAVDVAVITGQKLDSATIAKLISRNPKLVTCAEFQAPKGSPDYALLKSMIAGDPISARMIHSDNLVNGHFDALVVLASNRLPNMANDASAAILRRLDPLHLPSRATVSGAQEDRDLAAKLAKDAPIIARLLLAIGAKFDPAGDLPEKMRAAKDLADTTITPKVKRFLAEACIVDPAGFVPTTSQPGWSPGLRSAFEQWYFAEHGEYANIRPEALKADLIDAGKGKFVDARRRPPNAGRHANQVRGVAGLSLRGNFNTPPVRQAMVSILTPAAAVPTIQPGNGTP